MHTHDHDHHHGDGDLAAMLDLDAEVLHEYHAGIVAWVRDHAGSPATVADLGAGTGAGTFELLAQLPAATVVAVDASPEMLDRLTTKAAERGLAARVRPLAADLDAGWPADLGSPDLVWAANSMHHLTDPLRTLREIHAALRPGARLAVVELESFPTFLPDDIGVGRPGLEARLATAMSHRRAEDMPHLGSDWSTTLTGAGFKLRAERRFTADRPAPPSEATARYAYLSLRRSRDGLADLLPAEDLATLDALLDPHGPHSVLRRPDLTVHAERVAWLAERP
ncbi:class I SAM-dependent methyltransferase [Dactylosporangium sp. CA-092794]|uniref:class I SAM-dependent methyltransferase n=1 Tax=Dactylosporangium sp. CA-092794 TaxID=3239929 RepID=UPI003D935867